MDGEPSIYIKIHKIGGEVILAACDKELLGKKFRQGIVVLYVKESFYKGELVDEEGLKAAMKFATIMNLVGERCVKIALEEGYIDEDLILYVEGVPHAQMTYLFRSLNFFIAFGFRGYAFIPSFLSSLAYSLLKPPDLQ